MASARERTHRGGQASGRWPSSLVYVATLVAIFVGVLGYFTLYVRAQREHLVREASRHLDSIALQVHSRVTERGRLFAQVADESWCESEPQRLEDSLGLIPHLRPLPETPLQACGDRQRIVAEVDGDSAGHDLVYVACPYEPPRLYPGCNLEGAKPISASASLADLFRGIDPGSVFDEVMLADSRGEIFFQLRGAPFALRHIQEIDAPPECKQEPGGLLTSWRVRFCPDWAETGHWSAEELAFPPRLQSVVLAGEEYSLYAASVEAPDPPPSTREPRWVVLGLMSSERIGRESMAVPPDVLIVLLVALSLGILAPPLLKLFVIGPGERLRPFDVASVLVSGFAATAFATVFLLGLAAYPTLNEQLDRRLEELAGDVGDQLRAESSAMTGLLHAFFDWNQPSRMSRTDLPCIGGCDYLAEFFFTADPEGIQTDKWSIRKATTPRIDVGKRPYFKRANETGTGADLVISKTTGEPVLVVSRKNGEKVQAATARPFSLVRSVVPFGMAFTVTEPDGEVLLHTGQYAGHRENVLAEVQPSAHLRQDFGGDRPPRIREVEYHGRPHSMVVARTHEAEGIDLRVVAYRDRRWGRTLIFEAVLQSLIWILVMILLAVAGLAVFVRCSRRRLAEWIWPRSGAVPRGRCVLAVVAALALTVAAAGGLFQRTLAGREAILQRASEAHATASCRARGRWIGREYGDLVKHPGHGAELAQRVGAGIPAGRKALEALASRCSEPVPGEGLWIGLGVYDKPHPLKGDAQAREQVESSAEGLISWMVGALTGEGVELRRLASLSEGPGAKTFSVELWTVPWLPFAGLAALVAALAMTRALLQRLFPEELTIEGERRDWQDQPGGRWLLVFPAPSELRSWLEETHPCLVDASGPDARSWLPEDDLKGASQVLVLGWETGFGDPQRRAAVLELIGKLSRWSRQDPSRKLVLTAPTDPFELLEPCSSDFVPWLERLRDFVTVPPAAFTEEATPGFGDQRLAERNLVRSERHYRAIWSSLPDREKLALVHLAQDGFVNRADLPLLRRLVRRGYVRTGAPPRVPSWSFRRFLLDAADPAAVQAWERSSGPSSWARFRGVLMLVVAATVLFLIGTQPIEAKALFGMIAAAGPAVAGVRQLVVALRSSASSAVG